MQENAVSNSSVHDIRRKCLSRRRTQELSGCCRAGAGGTCASAAAAVSVTLIMEGTGVRHIGQERRKLSFSHFSIQQKQNS
jgi:hypothetical protein